MIESRVQKIFFVLTLTATILVAGTVILTSGILSSSFIMQSAGNLKSVGVGVYWEQSCNSEVTSIDWGNLNPGDTVSVTVYVKNEGNVAVELNMTTDNWDPSSASTYLTLTWDRQGFVLNSGEVVQAIFTLWVSPNIQNVTTFSFDIIVTGVEHS